MKKKIILVTGYCATGKSTFARRLSQTFNIPCFTKDTLKEAMADGFGSNSELLQGKGSTAATNIMLHIAECFLQTGKICILEANFRLYQGEQIKTLLEKYDADCLTFLFKGDLNILWNRYVQREAQRHWVHMNVGEDKEIFVNGHIEAGMGEVVVGETIKINATDFDKVNYEELLAIAEHFINS